MSEQKVEQTPVETLVTAPVETVAVVQEVAPTPPPAPKLAAGLFQGFTLGTTLKQGPTGNVVSNMKAAPMDYVEAYKHSTKNVQVTSEELAKLDPKK